MNTGESAAPQSRVSTLLSLHSCSTLYTNVATDVRVATHAGFGGLELWMPKVERFLAAGYTTADLARLLGPLRPTMLDVLLGVETSDRELWREQLERCARMASVAHRIGCPALQVVVLDDTGGMALRPWRRFVARRLKELAEVAADQGVRLGLEPVAFSPLRSLDETTELVHVVGADRLGLVLDTWHLWAGGESWERVAEVDPSMVVAAHIGDSAPRAGARWADDDRRALPGDGIVPVREGINAIVATGFRGPWAVELISPRHREWEPGALARELYDRARACLP